MKPSVALLAICAGFLLSTAHAQMATPADRVMVTGLPDPALTPGATNPAVTQATIGATICASGWTSTVRPPSGYTTILKGQQIARYGYVDTDLTHYEEDHLVPLELGGDPTDPRNLWPEPHHLLVNGNAPDLGAYAKDQVENRLKREVCAGTITLADAQHEIATDWEMAK